MDDDEVFAGIARLVEAGEYRDIIPGRPGADLDGDEHELEEWPECSWRRAYRRGTDRHLAARANGWVDPLPPLRPADPALVTGYEQRARRRLPALLRRLYLEVGNGGFGPQYGIGALHDWLVVSRDRSVAGPHRPRIGMVLCSWGNGGYSELDLADGSVWGTTAYRVPTGVPTSFRQFATVGEWFACWLSGRLFPPLLVQDAVSRDWRPGTEDEQVAALAEVQERRRNPEPERWDEDWN